MLLSKKRPLSDRQLAANRANAQLSTGPRTPEGKARSSQNARRRGFAFPRLDELDEVARLKDDLVALYQPVNSLELLTLERMALARHSLLCAARLEAGLGLALNRDGLPFRRYQARAERQYHQAIEEFERLKALRGKLRNEAKSARNHNKTKSLTAIKTPGFRPPGSPPSPPKQLYSFERPKREEADQ